jgi:hypothetical protein
MKMQAPLCLQRLLQKLVAQTCGQRRSSCTTLVQKIEAQSTTTARWAANDLRGLFSGASRRFFTQHGTHVALHGRGNDARR